MGSVVLVADETVAARRDVVYGLFGASHGAGWLFAADCDVLAAYSSSRTDQAPAARRQMSVTLFRGGFAVVRSAS